MSIKNIQKITGYSYSTISRVLNGKAKEFRISDETCKIILDAAKQVNYRPNMLARSLRLQKTMSIGLIVSDIQNPFFGELSSKIEVRLRKQGYSTILCNTNEIPENEEFYLQVLMDRKVDGIIIAPSHSEEWRYIEEIRKERAVVLIDRIFENSELPWVTSDNQSAAERLTCRLLELGYKKIAFLGGIPDSYITRIRYEGYTEAFRKHSVPIPKNKVLFKGYSSQAGEEMMEKILNKCPDVEAVFCVNNQVFFGAIKIVQKYEIREGRSIMMAAFDIGHYCNMFKRPLLCANQDMDSLAESAVNLLLDQIKGTSLDTHQIIISACVSDFRIG